MLFGGTGNDSILGGDGSDKIFGGDDTDKLIGDRGRDVLTGGNGADYLAGYDGSGFGDGATDIFDFNAITESDSSGHDLILDFEQKIDLIDLSDLSVSGINSIADLTIFDDGINTFITGNKIDFIVELSGVFSLTTADFIF